MSVIDDELHRRKAEVSAKWALAEGTRALLARQEQDARVAEANYDGFAAAVALLKQPSENVPRPAISRSNTASKRGGRQPGAISKIWRGILEGMSVFHPRGATDEQIADIGRKSELPNLRPRDVRRQMKKYRELGFVDYSNPITQSAWIVLPHAAEKFDIDVRAPAAEPPATADSPIDLKDEPVADNESATGFLQHWSVPRDEP